MRLSNVDKSVLHKLLKQAELLGIRFRLDGRAVAMAMYDGRLKQFQDALSSAGSQIEKALHE